MTHARAARELTGTKFSKNVARLALENALLVNARRPIAEFNKEFAIVEGDGDDAGESDDTKAVLGLFRGNDDVQIESSSSD